MSKDFRDYIALETERKEIEDLAKDIDKMFNPQREKPNVKAFSYTAYRLWQMGWRKNV